MFQGRRRVSKVSTSANAGCAGAPRGRAGTGDRGDIGAEDAARAEGPGRRFHEPPGLGQVQHHAVHLALLDPEIDVLRADGQRDARPQPGLDVPLGAARELLAHLVGDDAARGPHQPQEHERERARAEPGLDHRLARTDVGEQGDRRQILRVDDLGAPRHLEHVLGEGGAEGQVPGALARHRDHALGEPDSAS